MARWAGTAVGALLACCNIASALNPSLDLSQYAHKNWSVREGFFKGQVSSIAQTPDGYLWVGTEFGLLRFDGVQAVPWQSPTGEHLPSNFIRSLIAGRDGTLWIGTWEGLASWKEGKLRQYPGLAGQIVYALLEDREGTVWVASGERLCAIHNAAVQCYGEDGLFGNAIGSLYEDSRGNLWAGTLSALWRWKPGPPARYPMPDAGMGHAQDMLEGDAGSLLMATRMGIRQFIDGKVEAYPLKGGGPQLRPGVLARDRDGSLWIGTSNQGLLHAHDGKTDLFAQSDGLSSDHIQALFEDREGSMWVATPEGLDRFRDFAIPAISAKQGLSHDNIFSVLAPRDGGLWVGTRDGLDRWSNGETTIYRQGNSGLRDDSAESLFEDDHGRIWVASNHGIAYLDHGRFIPVDGVPEGQGHAIAGDPAGNLWISNERSLVHLLEERFIEQIPWATLGHKEPAATLLDDGSQGGIWLGFFQEGAASFKDGMVRVPYARANGQSEEHVNDLQLDGDGTLWVATDDGLRRVKDGHATLLAGKNGLPCDTVHWAREDDDHSFWLYMSCGLVRIPRIELDSWVTDSRRTIKVTVFDSADGVVSHSRPASGYSPRVSKSADGKLWFVTGDSVSLIDPRHLPFNKLSPPVNIEQIIADRKTYELSPNLRLPALTRDLEIDYTALSLVAPEKNRFRVKLEGHDRDWMEMGDGRKKFYSDLPPRNYRFRVMASNNDGVWNETGASFDFSVAPAYYQTSWFQALCGIAGLALVWGLYRYRLYQVAREFNVRLEERVGERTRIARDLHDTLLQSFQGLMLRLQVVDDMLPPGKAKVELEKTLDRADEAIAEGRTAVYDLRSSATATNDLAHAVREVGNELATPGAATFRLMVEGPVRDLHPIIRDEVYRVSREALRNAFSHARANHIEAELIYADRQFRLRIRDDGQGIASEFLGEGRPGHYGLPGMRERAKQIGAKLTIWSGAGAGTEIELSLDGSMAYGGTLSGGSGPGRSGPRLFRRKVG